MKKILITIIICSFINIAYSHENFQFYDNVKASYMFFTNPMNWSQAVNACKRENSTLAMPRNHQEVEVLLKIFSFYPQSMLRALGVSDPEIMLVGFHDIFQEGEFITLNGDDLQYYPYKWRSYKPNKKETEDCGGMYRNGENDDIRCQFKTVFICERRHNKQKKLTLLWPSRDTAYKKHPILDQCYKLHLNPQIWSVARTICKAEWSHLAIIKSKAEEDFLVSMLNDPDNKVYYKNILSKDYALLGFHDMYEENNYVTVLDESLYNAQYVRWASGEPNDAKGDQNCGSMHSSGGLSDFSCSIPAIYFCQIPCSENKPDRVMTPR